MSYIIAIVMILMYYLIFMLYYQKLFPVQQSRQILILLILAIVLASYVFLDTQELSGLRFPAVMLVMIVGLYFSTSMNWLQALYGGGLCVLSVYSFRGAFTLTGSLVFQGHSFSSETDPYYLITIFALPLALLLFWALRRTIFPDAKIKKLLNNKAQLKLIVIYEIMAAINLANINLGRSLSPYDIRYLGPYLSPHGIWAVKISIGSFLLTLSMLIYAVYQSIQSTELLEYRYKIQTLEEQYEQQLRHYKSYQKYTESFRIFKHDYKSMMVSLRALLKAGENERAIQLMDDLYIDMQKRMDIHKKYSDNVVLDAMLQDTANICEEKGIRFSFNIFEPRNTELSKLDAIRIFSNITKNAVEACQQVPLPERFIYISTRNDEQWVTLEAINSYDGKVFMDNEIPRTTKADKEEHGLGLSIIQEIVQNLGGFIIYTADRETKTFIIRVHIPRL